MYIKKTSWLRLLLRLLRKNTTGSLQRQAQKRTSPYQTVGITKGILLFVIRRMCQAQITNQIADVSAIWLFVTITTYLQLVTLAVRRHTIFLQGSTTSRKCTTTFGSITTPTLPTNVLSRYRKYTKVPFGSCQYLKERTRLLRQISQQRY